MKSAIAFSPASSGRTLQVAYKPEPWHHFHAFLIRPGLSARRHFKAEAAK
jgi:hypothetical protein